ncbi:glycosyltransferase [Candidatus Kaiserbacteria bacterium]|nr:glycosyltransferase [Candidatus Kaiserbacteria bacterium]
MISFIIPAHDEESIIVETLKHLRKGAVGIPYEIILSDDGSTDRTIELSGSYADRVVRYRGEIPKTIGAARNRGAREAGFPILFFLDSDVRIRNPETFFPAVLRHFESNARLVALTTSVRVYPEIETWADKLVLGFFDAYYRLANNVFGFGLTHGKCMIVRATAFGNIGGFDEKIIASEDADLFIRLSKIGRTLLDPSLQIYFSGRRAHAIGWIPLLTRWVLNGIWIVLFKRAYSTNWDRASGS